jgi:hypothetical protein
MSRTISASSLLIACALLALTSGRAHAQTTFYNTDYNSATLGTSHEYADDIPFSGAYRVTGFDVGLQVFSDPITIQVSFYAIDPNDGGTGKQLASFTMTGTATGDPFGPVHYDIPTDRQFTFAATPTVGRTYETGGWVSVKKVSGNAQYGFGTGGGSDNVLFNVEQRRYESPLTAKENSLFIRLQGSPIPGPGALLTTLLGAVPGLIRLRRRKVASSR